MAFKEWRGDLKGLERRLREEFEGDLVKVFAVVRDMALAGDMPAAKLFIDRMMGPPSALVEAMAKHTEIRVIVNNAAWDDPPEPVMPALDA